MTLHRRLMNNGRLWARIGLIFTTTAAALIVLGMAFVPSAEGLSVAELGYDLVRLAPFFLPGLISLPPIVDDAGRGAGALYRVALSGAVLFGATYASGAIFGFEWLSLWLLVFSLAPSIALSWLIIRAPDAVAQRWPDEEPGEKPTALYHGNPKASA